MTTLLAGPAFTIQHAITKRLGVQGHFWSMHVFLSSFCKQCDIAFAQLLVRVRAAAVGVVYELAAAAVSSVCVGKSCSLRFMKQITSILPRMRALFKANVSFVSRDYLGARAQAYVGGGGMGARWKRGCSCLPWSPRGLDNDSILQCNHARVCICASKLCVCKEVHSAAAARAHAWRNSRVLARKVRRLLMEWT